MDYKATWIPSAKIKPEDSAIPITQVYVWIYTKDKKLIIVSKDNQKWQLPGGHPKSGETIPETAIREVMEETGLDISINSKDINFFGYYNIEASGTGIVKEKFLQVRTCLKLDSNSDKLELKTSENEEELEEDKIKFNKAATLNEVFTHIPWLKTKEEYLTLKATDIL